MLVLEVICPHKMGPDVESRDGGKGENFVQDSFYLLIKNFVAEVPLANICDTE